MGKPRILADTMSNGGILADGIIEAAEIDNVTATAAELNILDGATVTTTELNTLSGVTSSIQSQIDAIDTDLLNDTTPQLGGNLDLNTHTVNGTGNINISGTITSTDVYTTNFYLGGTAVTATAAELNYVDGVTSNVQTQLDAKASTASPTFTGTLTYATLNDGTTDLTSTVAELNYVDGVTSNVQTQLDSKVALSGGTMTGLLVLSADPTATLGAATKQYVDTQVASVVDSAPATLDTLNELAAALNDDANFSTTVTTSLASKLENITGESISDLSDVYSSMSPTDGQVLTYDTTNGWQAETLTAATTDEALALAIALG